MPDVSFFLPLVLQSALVPFGVALAVLAAARAAQAAATGAAPAVLAAAPAARAAATGAVPAVQAAARVAQAAPTGVALAVLAAARAAQPAATGAALAVGAAFLSAWFAAFHAQWSPVPKVALDWLPWIAIGVTGGALAVERIAGAGLRLAARFALSLAVGALVARPALAALGPQKAIVAATAAGLLMGVSWTYMARIAGSRPTPPLLLSVVAGGAALALMLDSSQAIGQLSGALAALLAACVAFNLPRARMAFSPAAAGVAVLLLGALLANAHIYAGFPLGYIALLVGGLLADPLVEGLNRLRRQASGAASWAATAVLAAIPAAATIGLAVKAAADAGGY